MKKLTFFREEEHERRWSRIAHGREKKHIAYV